MGAIAAVLTALGANVAGPAPMPEAVQYGAVRAIADAAVVRADRAERRATRAERVARESGAGTRITSGRIDSLDPVSELRGDKWYGSPGKLGLSRKMLTDGQVRQSISYVTDPLVAATWRFRPTGKNPRPVDIEAADYATWCFLEQLPWDQTLERIVADYAADGFSLNEVTDNATAIDTVRFPLHPGRGRGVAPTGIHEIPASTVYRWLQSTSIPDRLAGVEQYIQGSDAEAVGFRTISADRILRWTYQQRAAGFEGFPILRSAYAPWKLKRALLTIWAIKHERLGIGVPVATASADATEDDLAAAELALKEMRANERGYLVLPNGWGFEWKGATASDGTNLELALQIADNAIAQNVSAGFMQLGLSTASGSNALSGTQQGQYHLSEVKHARFYAGGWNLGYDGWSPIARIIRLNYGEGVALPVLEARNLPTANWAQRLPIAVNAVNVGALRIDENVERAFREALEIDPFDPATERPRRGAQVAMLPDSPQKQDEQRRQASPQPAPAEEKTSEPAPKEAVTDAPDNTTPKEEQTIFGYHLQFGIAKINEARKNLNLPPVPYGDQTVPEFLATLDSVAPRQDAGADSKPQDDSPEEDA